MCYIADSLNAQLRRCLTERRLAGTPPYELRHVIADALRAWLDKHAPK